MELVNIDALVVLLIVFVGPIAIGFIMMFFEQLGSATRELFHGNFLHGLIDILRLGFFLVLMSFCAWSLYAIDIWNTRRGKDG